MVLALNDLLHVLHLYSFVCNLKGKMFHFVSFISEMFNYVLG